MASDRRLWEVTMPDVDADLLSGGLQLIWERGHEGDRQLARLLSERKPRYTKEAYASALKRARALNDAAWKLADAWHESRGKAIISQEQLEARCPGFTTADYADAIRNNLTWARK
jgi:hypothetical protein